MEDKSTRTTHVIFDFGGIIIDLESYGTIFEQFGKALDENWTIPDMNLGQSKLIFYQLKNLI